MKKLKQFAFVTGILGVCALAFPNGEYATVYLWGFCVVASFTHCAISDFKESK